MEGRREGGRVRDGWREGGLGMDGGREGGMEGGREGLREKGVTCFHLFRMMPCLRGRVMMALLASTLSTPPVASCLPPSLDAVS